MWRGTWDGWMPEFEGNINECQAERLNQSGTAPDWEQQMDDRQVGMRREGCRIYSYPKWPYACKSTSNRIHLPRISSPFASLHCQTQKLGRPRFISVWHISDIFCFKLAVRDSHRFERHEERKVDFKEDSELQGRASRRRLQRSSVRESVMLCSCKNWGRIAKGRGRTLDSLSTHCFEIRYISSSAYGYVSPVSFPA